MPNRAIVERLKAFIPLLAPFVILLAVCGVSGLSAMAQAGEATAQPEKPTAIVLELIPLGEVRADTAQKATAFFRRALQEEFRIKYEKDVLDSLEKPKSEFVKENPDLFDIVEASKQFVADAAFRVIGKVAQSVLGFIENSRRLKGVDEVIVGSIGLLDDGRYVISAQRITPDGYVIREEYVISRGRSEGFLPEATGELVNKLMGKSPEPIVASAQKVSTEAVPTATAPPKELPLTLQIWGEKAVYYRGDELRIFFRASRDCYVTLIDYGTSGKVHVIYPNGFAPDNFVRGGRIYAIPEESHGYVFKVGGPVGIERIVGIATLERHDFVGEDLSKGAVVFKEVRDTERLSRDIEVVAKKTPETECSRAEMLLEIR